MNTIENSITIYTTFLLYHIALYSTECPKKKKASWIMPVFVDLFHG
jgi:hypothetical protein